MFISNFEIGDDDTDVTVDDSIGTVNTAGHPNSNDGEDENDEDRNLILTTNNTNNNKDAYSYDSSNDGTATKNNTSLIITTTKEVDEECPPALLSISSNTSATSSTSTSTSSSEDESTPLNSNNNKDSTIHSSSTTNNSSTKASSDTSKISNNTYQTEKLNSPQQTSKINNNTKQTKEQKHSSSNARAKALEAFKNSFTSLPTTVCTLASSSATSSTSTPLTKSTLYIQGVCCALDVPPVTKIIKSSNPVYISKVRVNITTRLVYIEYESERIKLKDICKLLQHEGFPAIIKSNGEKKRNLNGNNGVCGRTNAICSPSSSSSTATLSSPSSIPMKLGSTFGAKWDPTKMSRIGREAEDHTSFQRILPSKSRSTTSSSNSMYSPLSIINTMNPINQLNPSSFNPLDQVKSSPYVESTLLSQSLPLLLGEGIDIPIQHQKVDSGGGNSDDFQCQTKKVVMTLTSLTNAIQSIFDTINSSSIQQQTLVCESSIDPSSSPANTSSSNTKEPSQGTPQSTSSITSSSTATTTTSSSPSTTTSSTSKPNPKQQTTPIRAFYIHIPSRTIKIEHVPTTISATEISHEIMKCVDDCWDDLIVHVDGEKERLFLPVDDDDEEEEEEDDNEYELNNDTNEEAGLDVESGMANMPSNQSNKNGRGENNNSYEWKKRSLPNYHFCTKYTNRISNMLLQELNCALWNRSGTNGHDVGHGVGLRLNIVLSGIFWVISMLGEIVASWDYLTYAGIFSVLFGIPPILLKSIRTLQRCQFDSNCMMVTAALGALVLGEYDEAASVAFLFSISEYLEDRATSKARIALDEIVKLRPDHANVVDPVSGLIRIVPADGVPVGSLVSVRTGDKIPADGVVVEGQSQVDESSLTGEAKPIAKTIEDVVSGGTINIGLSRLMVRTTSSVEDSAVSRLITLVEEAQSNRSPTEQIIEKFARFYTPIVVSFAALLCTIPWIFGRDVGRYWALNGLIVIVISCPCALTISTPVTYSAGLAATAQKGIIVKGGARLEALGGVKTVLFDKTGTLTKSKFQLLHLIVIGDAKTRKEILELLSVMEAPSSHPLATALIDSAKKEGVVVSSSMIVKDHSILKGEGVTGILNDTPTYVGNTRLFERLGYYQDLSDSQKNDAVRWSQEGGTVGFLGMEGIGIIAMFCVADSVRDEAKEVITSLKSDDIEVVMVTGDDTGAANAVGAQLGILQENIHSRLTPDDKLHFLASLQGSKSKTDGICSSSSNVLLCGDGVNDAPALAFADLSVAMGGGASLALELSDVTLMDSNLEKLLYAMKMGSKTIATVKENITFSIFSKVVVVILTMYGQMTLLAAIASDVGVMLVVSLNGMKLISSDRPRETRTFCRCFSRRQTRRDKYQMIELSEMS